MNEADDFAPSSEGGKPSVVGERVTAVLKAAETAAGAIRHEAEQEAQVKRRAAEAEAAAYVDEKKREADELLASRLRRISEVSDGLVERMEAISSELDEAVELRRRVEALVSAAGEAADDLTREIAQPDRPALSVVRSEEKASAARPEPPAEPEREPEPRRTASRDEEPELSPLERLRAASDSAGDLPARDRRGRFRRERDDDEAPVADDDLLGARLVALQMAVAGCERADVDAHLRSEFKLDDPSAILDEVFGKAGASR